MRDSMVFYRGFMEALDCLDAETYKQAVQGIMKYAMDEEEPDLTGAAKMAFLFMKPQIDANNRRYDNGRKGAEYGKKGGRPKKATPEEPLDGISETPVNPLKNPCETPKKPLNNPTETPCGENETPNVNVNVNVNENVNEIHKERLVPKRTNARAQKPGSVEEVEQYMQTMQNGPANPSQTASAFYDYFESNGWKVGGKAPMKDWQAAARNWCRNEKTFRQPQGQKPMTRFHNFEQRPETDLDAEMLELSRKALGI